MQYIKSLLILTLAFLLLNNNIFSQNSFIGSSAGLVTVGDIADTDKLDFIFNSVREIDKVDSTFDLYLLFGQSNMAGRGVITVKYLNDGHPDVFMLDKENQWVLARHPLHFDKPGVAGVGPGLSLGIMMAKKSNGHKIGLIPCAVGGTSINVWQPGGFDKATKTHPYDDAIKRLEVAMQSGKLKGVIWLQGESDSSPEKSVGYLEKLVELITRIRQIADNPSLPFVAGQLGRYKKEYENINEQLKKLPSIVKHTAVVSSKRLIDKGDNTHFDAASAEKYGKRFAKKVLCLQKKIN